MENQKYKNLKPSLLIVGGAGFIGYHLAAKVKNKGWKVTNLFQDGIKNSIDSYK